MRRYKSEAKRYISIHIGEYHASARPEIISTVVGSCVAVCLFEPVKKIGGMNHILLPGTADWNDFDFSARYGINAMELLINRMMKLGAERKKIIAKAFGGACTLPAMNSKDHVGIRNSEFVVEFLEKEGLRLASCSLGGTTGRKVFFHTDSGVVFIKRLIPAAIRNLMAEEKKKQQQIMEELNKTGEVILF